MPEPFELEYLDIVHELEESKKMPYITTAERFGIEKGRKEGMEKGKLEVAEHLLEDGAKPVYVKKMTGLSLEKLKKLQQKMK